MSTTLWLPSSGVAPVSPAYSAYWAEQEVNSSIARRPTSTVKGSTAEAVAVAWENSAVNGVTTLTKQFVSTETVLSDRTIDGTISLDIYGNMNNDTGGPALVVKVVSGDGLTVRGTLLEAAVGSFATTPTVTRVTWAAQSVTPVAALAGDRIVIELGARMTNTTTTGRQANMYVGETGARQPSVTFSTDVFALPTPYAEEVLADTPLAYYRLGEAIGTTLVDSSGNGRNGTYTGSTLSAVGLIAGDSDPSVDFSGGYGSVASAAWMNQTSWSVEAWVRADTIAGNDTIVRRDHDAAPMSELTYCLRLNAGKPEVFMADSTGALVIATAATAITVGRIVHLVATFTDSDKTLRLYANNTLVASAVAAVGANVSAATPLVIGVNGVGAEPFDGRIDEVAIYSTALTAARIDDHFVAGCGGAYPAAVRQDDPLVYWKFDEVAGTVATDSTGIGRDGTLLNGATPNQTSLVATDPGKAVDLDAASGQSVQRATESWMAITTGTVEGWFYLDGAPGSDGEHVLMCKDNSAVGFSSRAWQVAVNDATGIVTWMAFYTSTARFICSSAAGAMPRNVLRHVVATYDGTTARLYLDGAEVASVAQAGSLRASGYALQVGKEASGNTRSMNGQADEFAMYSTALSAARVLAHYEAGVGGGDLVVELDGALPALAGSFDVDLEDFLAVQVAGTLPGLAGDFETEVASSVEVAGLLPGLQGSVETELVTPVELDGEIRFSGAFALVDADQMSVSLAGELPDLAGSFVLDYPLVLAGTSQIVDFSVQPGVGSVTPELALVILDPAQERAPTSLQVTVGGANPGAELTFSIAGVDVWHETADAEGYLGHTSIPVPGTVAAGTHVLTVTSSTNGSDAEDFTLAKAPSPYPVTQTADVDPVFIEGSEGRWVLQDVMPGGLGSWIMPIGPQTMSSPHVEKQVNVGHTTAIEGPYQVAVAGLQTKAWQLAGYAPNEEYQAQLRAYAELKRRLYLIDHRGRAWVVGIQSCKIEPRKRQNDSIEGVDNDWAGNWTMTAVIYDQSWVTPV